MQNYIEILYDNDILECDRITLRRFKKEDAEDIFEYASDEKVLKYLVWNGLCTVDETRQSIVNYYWSRPGIYAIGLKENCKCIGCLDIRLEPEHEKAGFGYVY